MLVWDSQGGPVTISARNSLDFEKPLLSEGDIYGCTHQGNVRKTNADHFLVASFHRAMKVHASSLPDGNLSLISPDTRGLVALVADGVGGLAHGEDGSAQATDAAARYLLEMREISLQAEPDRESEVIERLRTLATGAHQRLLAFADRVGGLAATTITMLIVIWPRLFVVHAGDSRCYRLRDGAFEQLTTDQTMAQAMIDAGAMSRASAEHSTLKDILFSALGAPQFEMQVVSSDVRRSDRFLLCTDGLTRYVSNEEIGALVATPRSAEDVCTTLRDLALARGGGDNITVICGGPRVTNRPS
jgi:serine/threonine protein phosphatase PrpC